MTEPLDKDALTQGIAALVAAAHPVAVGAITDAELDDNPALVKSMSVSPPRGSGTVRTIRIGAAGLIDLQPCGGTHVANTAEIGAVVVTKIEKKRPDAARGVGFRMTRLAWFFLALWAPVALAQAAPPQPDIHLIWMGGDDCPPCKAWRTTELPQLLAAPGSKACASATSPNRYAHRCHLPRSCRPKSNR